MVPCSGTASNSQSPLSAEWNERSKEGLESPYGLPEGMELEQLFDTLAEWNTYLENHVPYFSERSATEECEP